MRILFVAPYAPDPLRTRARALVLGLLEGGHEVVVAAPTRSPHDVAALAELHQAGAAIVQAPLSGFRMMANLLTTIPRATPYQARICWAPELLEAVSDLVARTPPDVIHVEHMRAGVYAEALAGRGVPVVWDSVDCVSGLLAQALSAGTNLRGRLMARLDVDRTRRFESRLMRRFERTLVTSAAERDALIALGRQRGGEGPWEDRIEVLGNGVDTAAFAAAGQAVRADTLVFSGKMSYHANDVAARRLVRQIMPLIWRRRPDAVLRIVGASPTQQLKRAAAAAEGRVEVTGWVREMAPELASAAVAVAPMCYGAGVQNKVLEALACGVPVVATETAVSGLPAGGADYVDAADDDAEIAAAVLRLLEDEPERVARGQRGRDWAREHAGWPAVARRLEDIYRLAMAEVHRHPARAPGAVSAVQGSM